MFVKEAGCEPPRGDSLADRPSIARLLSISSGKTDSSLPEVTSG
ncbi:unnamed protein product, partial [Ectocarpus sp. 12 AP-2014]